MRALPKGTVIVDGPLGIVRNPGIGFGRAVVASRWIACFVLAGRYRAGESIAQLMRDYDLSRKDVRNALAYIEKRRPNATRMTAGEIARFWSAK